MTTYDAGSELMRAVRASRGASTRISRDLSDVIALALKISIVTDGVFDPTVGPILRAWDLKGPGRAPDPGEIEAALRLVGWEKVRHDPAGRTLSLAADGMELDLGGVGKGFALDRARDVLRGRGVRRAVFDFGGQILVMGDSVFTVAVALPGERGVPAVDLRVRGLSVSTSDMSQRFVHLPGGGTMGHIVDPRSGRPVSSADQATACHPSAAKADAYSTAALLMSADEITKLSASEPRLSVLVFRQDGDGKDWTLEAYNARRLDPRVLHEAVEIEDRTSTSHDRESTEHVEIPGREAM
jgi:thiamine biosynthesis lipoprotein